VQEAKIKNKKDRMGEGVMLRVRRELMGQKVEERREMERLITGRVKYGKDNLRVVGVYVNKDLAGKLEEMREWIEEKKKGVRTIIGGGL